MLITPLAVAENQPAAREHTKQNRMTNDLTFSAYATRLCAFIRQTSSAVASDDRLSLIESEQQFNRLALDLFALQFEHNSSYRQFCRARKLTPETVLNWVDIPAIPAVAFKELELTSLAPAERMTVFHSSGTTEQKPSRHFHSAESLAAYEAALLPWFQAHLRADFASEEELPTPVHLKFIFLTPSPALAPHSSLVHMFEVIRQKFGSRDSLFTGQLDATSAWQLDLDKTLAALHPSISASQPIALLGTAFTFVHLVDHLTNTHQRLQLPEGSRVMETGGYKGRARAIPKSQLHALITSQLGVPSSHLICEYGMSELSSQA